MKKATLLSVCIATILYSTAQETPAESPQPILTKDEYLKKSKSQKTGAIILISAGGAAAIAGMAIAADDLGDDLGGLFDPNYQEADSDDTVSGILFFGGVAAMLGSIPLFVSSRKNKKRAMTISFQNIPSTQIQKTMVMKKAVPSITVAFPF